MSGDELSTWVRRKLFSSLDVHFARTIAKLAGEEANGPILLAAALASRAVRQGHVCIDLGRLGEEALLNADGEEVVDLLMPPREQWLAQLRSSPLVAATATEAMRPLVLDPAGRIYLHRYAVYQHSLVQDLLQRSAAQEQVDEMLLAEGLDRLFGPVDEASPDMQREAALTAARRRLCVVSGGPGTGKTTTVARLLVLLQEQALAVRGGLLRMMLVAPTGKAAQRLAAAIVQQLDKLDCSEAVRAAVPRQASTLHRALGFQSRTPSRFRHHADNPLPVDVVVADEASMIDLPLMAKLVEAVPPQARLILLGDKDQLVSVQVGAVLGDIYCPDSLWSEQAGQALQSTPTAAGKSPSPMAACVVELSRSYRYDERSGIGALARAIKAGDVELALRVLRDETGMPYGDVALAELDEQAPLAGPLGVAVRAGFGGWFALEDPAARLACLSRFRILCAHRQGPFGVQALNDLVERCLREELGIQTEALHYDGRPILVTQNDYQLGLFNGDVGVVMVDGQGRARVYFESADGPPRSVAAGRMPPHETVYAMSVHKSQGSELDRVALLMPRSSSPILTRELIYTGISRARSRVDLFGNEQVLREALSRRVERASGIRDALWSPAGAGW